MRRILLMAWLVLAAGDVLAAQREILVTDGLKVMREKLNANIAELYSQSGAGALSGVLTGTLPSPGLADGVVAANNLAPGAVTLASLDPAVAGPISGYSNILEDVRYSALRLYDRYELAFRTGYTYFIASDLGGSHWAPTVLLDIAPTNGIGSNSGLGDGEGDEILVVGPTGSSTRYYLDGNRQYRNSSGQLVTTNTTVGAFTTLAYLRNDPTTLYAPARDAAAPAGYDATFLQTWSSRFSVYWALRYGVVSTSDFPIALQAYGVGMSNSFLRLAYDVDDEGTQAREIEFSSSSPGSSYIGFDPAAPDLIEAGDPGYSNDGALEGMTRHAGITFRGPGLAAVIGITAGATNLYRVTYGLPFPRLYRVWDAGNDGERSGLVADQLDGWDATNLPPSAAMSNTFFVAPGGVTRTSLVFDASDAVENPYYVRFASQGGNYGQLSSVQGNPVWTMTGQTPGSDYMIWTRYNDGAASALDAGLFAGQLPAYYDPARWSSQAATQQVTWAAPSTNAVLVIPASTSTAYVGSARVRFMTRDATNGNLAVDFWADAGGSLFTKIGTNAARVVYTANNLTPSSLQTKSDFDRALTNTLVTWAGWTPPAVPTDTGRRGRMFETNGYLVAWSEASNQWGWVQLSFGGAFPWVP